MPENIERDKREADRRKNQLIEAGFRLFSQERNRNCQRKWQTLQMSAHCNDVQIFLTKRKNCSSPSVQRCGMIWQGRLWETPEPITLSILLLIRALSFYADRMIALYKNRPEVLRFSGEYKTYI